MSPDLSYEREQLEKLDEDNRRNEKKTTFTSFVDLRSSGSLASALASALAAALRCKLACSHVPVQIARLSRIRVGDDTWSELL